MGAQKPEADNLKLKKETKNQNQGRKTIKKIGERHSAISRRKTALHRLPEAASIGHWNGRGRGRKKLPHPKGKSGE